MMKFALFVLLLTVPVLNSLIHILGVSPLQATGSVSPFRGSPRYQRLYKKTLIRFGALKSHHPIKKFVK